MATINEMLDSGTIQLPRVTRRWRRYKGKRERPSWIRRWFMSWAVLAALVARVYADGRRQAREARVHVERHQHRAMVRHRAAGRASWFAPRLVETRHRYGQLGWA